MPTSKPTIRFPGESKTYRTARNQLLDAEIALRRHVEAVAELRRALPTGGEVPQDYLFHEKTPRSVRAVQMSQLFDEGKDTLLIYNFMYGPQMKTPCSMCTSFLDSLDGEATQIAQRANLVVVAKSPIERIQQFAKQRGWRNLRLLSSSECTYNQDYHGETVNGDQMPIFNVFVRRDGKIHHFYGTETLYTKSDAGQDARHIDAMWPLWNVLDLTPEGRGEKWYPRVLS